MKGLKRIILDYSFIKRSINSGIKCRHCCSLYLMRGTLGAQSQNKNNIKKVLINLIVIFKLVGLVIQAIH